VIVRYGSTRISAIREPFLVRVPRAGRPPRAPDRHGHRPARPGPDLADADRDGQVRERPGKGHARREHQAAVPAREGGDAVRPPRHGGRASRGERGRASQHATNDLSARCEPADHWTSRPPIAAIDSASTRARTRIADQRTSAITATGRWGRRRRRARRSASRWRVSNFWTPLALVPPKDGHGSCRPEAGVARGAETPARCRGHSPGQVNRVGRQLARRRLHNAGYERASGRQKKDCQEPGMYGVLPSDRMRRDHTCHSF
jgi:hypothetical protein